MFVKNILYLLKLVSVRYLFTFLFIGISVPYSNLQAQDPDEEGEISWGDEEEYELEEDEFADEEEFLDDDEFYEDEEDSFTSRPRMYNSPQKPTRTIDPNTGEEVLVNDSKKRSTLISDQTRVYKGGAWSDREYWLDPAQRRYLPEYMATNYIGFRCVTDKVGPMSSGKRTARNPSR